MKKLFSVLVVFQIFSFESMYAHNTYAAFAKSWCHAYIYDESNRLRVSFEDLQAVRELIQLSADRAAITLQAQEIALQTLILFWQTWQNLSQTRLNPSHERPYRAARAQCIAFDQFWGVIEDQELCSKRYSDTAQRIVHGGALSHQLSKDAVENMRAQARIYMVDALADVKKQLGNLYDIAFHKSQEADLLSDDTDVQRGLNIAEFILSYVPNLAMHSFIHADKAHNLISSEGWLVLEKVQHIGNQVWNAIESARYAFYQALLDELDAHK